jgi:hypothetical protein
MNPDSTEISEKDKLVVVWTSGDKEVAEKMVFMYEKSDKLEKIGVTVRYTGTDLTDYIKNRHVITF